MRFTTSKEKAVLKVNGVTVRVDYPTQKVDFRFSKEEEKKLESESSCEEEVRFFRARRCHAIGKYMNQEGFLDIEYVSDNEKNTSFKWNSDV